MRFIIGIDLKGYRSQEFPQSAICRLENQKIKLHNSEFKDMRTRRSKVQGQKMDAPTPEERIQLFAPHRLDSIHPYW